MNSENAKTANYAKTANAQTAKAKTGAAIVASVFCGA